MIDYNEMTDEALAIAYGQGDNRAFDILLSRTQQKVYAYIMYVVRDAAVADDVFQDTFVKVVTRLRQGAYRPLGQCVAWIVRIAHNIIVDRFREKKQRPQVPVDGALSPTTAVLRDDSSRETTLCEEQTLREARELMDALPASQREIVYMRLYQQMSFREIADTTGVSINTALGRMRYAVLNMRRMAAQRHLSW